MTDQGALSRLYCLRSRVADRAASPSQVAFLAPHVARRDKRLTIASSVASTVARNSGSSSVVARNVA